MMRTDSMASAAVRHNRWPSLSPTALPADRITLDADVKDKIDISGFSSNDQLADAAVVNGLNP
jgi:hypothetical protein